MLTNQQLFNIVKKRISFFFSAEPFIEEGFKEAPESAHLVVVEVGDRP